MALFDLVKAIVVPFCIALKILGFIGRKFVGKLTKRTGYYKCGWSKVSIALCKCTFVAWLFSMLCCLSLHEVRKGKFMRLSIEVTQEQHQRLKAVSALRGQSIKDYVLERVFQPLPEINTSNEEEALRQLEAFLKPRVDAAEQGLVVNKSVQQIFEETHQEEMR